MAFLGIDEFENKEAFEKAIFAEENGQMILGIAALFLSTIERLIEEYGDSLTTKISVLYGDFLQKLIDQGFGYNEAVSIIRNMQGNLKNINIKGK